VPGDGEAKTVRITPTEFKDRARTEEETRTAVALNWSFNFATRYGTVYVWMGRNATATDFAAAESAALLGATTDNSVTKQKSAQFKDRFDYEIVKRPFLDTSTYQDTGWEGFGEEKFDNVDVQGRAYRVVKVRTSNRSKASGYAQGTWASTGSYGQTSANYALTGQYGGATRGYWYLGLGRWVGVRVELLKTDFGLP
jgi:hypothetical protein